jgi:hypothetical protein
MRFHSGKMPTRLADSGTIGVVFLGYQSPRLLSTLLKEIQRFRILAACITCSVSPLLRFIG